eukprot:Sspe_Gene.86470::Locus_57137_Transcript_1_1_Confidence_1.000_Length_1304::g.86470::m.86470
MSYMRHTMTSRSKRFNSESNRLMRLTNELVGVQNAIADRMAEYQRECLEAGMLVSQAAALSMRLREVRRKLQMAFALSRGDIDVDPLPLPDDSPYQALPGLGIMDAVESTARLPEFSDGLDEAIGDAPHEFMCPITCSIMRDPVLTSDGHTYERRAIEEWFRSYAGDGVPNSPLTNLPLEHCGLTPNTALAEQIRDWIATHAPQTSPAEVVRECKPYTEVAPANHLSDRLQWHGAQAPAAPIPDSPPDTSSSPRPIWSSSVVPERELNATTLNSLRNRRSFVPDIIPETPLSSTLSLSLTSSSLNSTTTSRRSLSSTSRSRDLVAFRTPTRPAPPVGGGRIHQSRHSEGESIAVSGSTAQVVAALRAARRTTQNLNRRRRQQ